MKKYQTDIQLKVVKRFMTEDDGANLLARQGSKLNERGLTPFWTNTPLQTVFVRIHFGSDDLAVFWQSPDDAPVAWLTRNEGSRITFFLLALR